MTSTEEQDLRKSLLGGSIPHQEYPSVRPEVEKAFDGRAVIANSPVVSGNVLSEKEREIAQREEELRQREADLRGDAFGGREYNMSGKPKNWPVCYPLVRLNIEEDVLPDRQKLVQAAYVHFYCNCACLAINVIGIISYWATDFFAFPIFEFALSLVYVLAGIPCSFCLWFYPLYLWGKNSKSPIFTWFTVIFAIHMVYVTLMLVGLPYTAGSGIALGLITMIFKKNVIAGLIILGISVLWGFNLFWSILVMRKTILLFRVSKRSGFDEV